MKKDRDRSINGEESWENEGGHVSGGVVLPDLDSVDELCRWGIVPVTLTVFDWGGYRYSNAKDALAAAKRAIRRA